MTPSLHNAFPGQSLDLYGEAELMDTLAHNREQGLVPDPAHEQASSVLGQLAAEVTAGAEPFAGLDPSFRETVDRSRSTMDELLEPLGIAVPELTDLAEWSVDLPALAESYAVMENLGLEPELVFAPTLSIDQWQQVYQNLQDNPVANHDGRIKDGGLYIDSTVQNHWDELQDQEPETGSNVDKGDITWRILVVPGTERPTVTNVDHNGTNGQQATLTPELSGLFGQLSHNIPLRYADGLHPTIPAYLTLQATRLNNHESPLDSNTWTWLHGEFTENNSLQAPSGNWHPGAGQVDVDWDGVDSRHDNLGVRLPVWG